MIHVISNKELQIINTNQFPNNEIYFNPLNINTEFDIIWYFNDNKDLIELYLFVNYIKQLNLIHLLNELNIAYLPYSRMDRIDMNNQNLFSLKYIADFINSMNIKQIRLNDIHSDISLQLINNSYNINITNYLFNKYFKYASNNELTIMFPDKGAYERYKGQYSQYNIIYGEKVRDFKSGHILGLTIHGDIKPNHQVVIIDDLTSKGTTFVKSSEKLKELGYNNIYLIIAHAEVTMLNGDLFNCDIKDVITTDSMLKSHNLDLINDLRKPKNLILEKFENIYKGDF